jgi:hypothetical protein
VRSIHPEDPCPSSPSIPPVLALRRGKRHQTSAIAKPLAFEAGPLLRPGRGKARASKIAHHDGLAPSPEKPLRTPDPHHTTMPPSHEIWSKSPVRLPDQTSFHMGLSVSGGRR